MLIPAPDNQGGHWFPLLVKDSGPQFPSVAGACLPSPGVMRLLELHQGVGTVCGSFDLLAQVQTFLRPKVSQRSADYRSSPSGPWARCRNRSMGVLGEEQARQGKAGVDRVQPRPRVPWAAGGRGRKVLGHFVLT